MAIFNANAVCENKLPVLYRILEPSLTPGEQETPVQKGLFALSLGTAAWEHTLGQSSELLQRQAW